MEMSIIGTRVIKSTKFSPPLGATKWYKGCHLVVVSTGKTTVLGDDGVTLAELNTDDVIFLPGLTQDVLITRNTDLGTFQAHPLRDGEIVDSITIQGKNLNSAHLALDHFLVLVVDRQAIGYDLTESKPTQCSIVGFHIPYEAVTAVYTHFFVIWTRDSRYMINLSEGSMSAIIDSTITKVVYDEPLTMDQTIVFATHNVLVTRNSTGIVLYDAAGQAFFKKTQDKTKDIVKVGQITGGGCGFFCGDTLFSLYNHRISQNPVPEAQRNLIILIGSEFYLYDPLNDTLGPTSLENSGDFVVLLSPASDSLTVIGGGFLKKVRVGDFIRIPTTTAIEKWEKIGSSNLADMFTPFVYQCGKSCFVWHLEEPGCIRLNQLTINGVGTSVNCYNLRGLLDEPNIPEIPTWKSSGRCVALRLGNKVFVMDAVNGRSICGSITVSSDVVLECILHYGIGVWIVLTQRGGSNVREILHVSVDNKGTVTNMTSLMKNGIFTEHGCLDEGTLILHSPSTESCFYVYPMENEKRGFSNFLKEKIQIIGRSDSGLYAIEDNSYVSRITKDNTTEKRFSIPESLVPVRSFHSCDLKTVIIGDRQYGVAEGNTGKFDLYELPQTRSDFTVFAANKDVDPKEKTLLIYNQEVVFNIRDPSTLFKNLTPKTFGETLVLAPGHFAAGITTVNPGQGFAQKVENAIITYVM